MELTNNYLRKRFECDCHWAAHSLVLEKEEYESRDGIEVMLSVYVANHRFDHSFWMRLKSAWAVLRGNEHILSEVVLDREQINEFVDFSCSLVTSPNTR